MLHWNVDCNFMMRQNKTIIIITILSWQCELSKNLFKRTWYQTWILCNTDTGYHPFQSAELHKGVRDAAGSSTVLFLIINVVSDWRIDCPFTAGQRRCNYHTSCLFHEVKFSLVQSSSPICFSFSSHSFCAIICYYWIIFSCCCCCCCCCCFVFC